MHKSNARVRQQFRQYLPTAMIGILSFALSTGAFANPVLDNVAHGNISIQQTNTTTTINQTTQKGIVNWQSFNINQGEHTHFNQPNGGVTLNRINPNQGASQIFGKLSATGKIILVNPAGVFIGPSAFINVGGLVASTAGISNENFLNGYYNFNQLSPYAGAIFNKGTIIAADHGLVALMGHAVSNEGVIQANMGKIALASGEAFTMSFAGSDMISFVVDKEVMQRGVDANGNSLSDGVTNTGILRANGGQILLHAKSAAGVLDNVINLEGIVEAKTVQDIYGEIVLTTDNNIESVIRVAGNLDATGFSAGERGGNITVTGYNVLIDSPTLLDASGDAGGGNIRIGGNYLGQGPIANAKAVVLAPGAVIKANALNHGDGGEVIFWSDNYTNIQGDRIEARGGSQSGNGGFIETSSKDTLAVGEIVIDTSAENGETGVWLLDPRNVTVTGSTSGGSFDGGSPTNTFTPTADNATVSNTSIQTNLASANVTVTTGATGAQNGDITVSSGITWSSTNTLTLDAAGDIVINAGISGVNGSLALSAGSSTNTITTGASGTIAVANFDLQRGIWTQVGTLPSFSVTNNFQINSGTVPNANARFIRALSGDGSSAGANAYAITDIYGLQGMASDTTTLADHFKLANDIDASGTTTWNGGSGFAPIGNTASPFTASVDGQNFEILNLSINRATTRLGLFGETQTGSTISNIGLANTSITSTAGGNVWSGSLVGYSRSVMSNVYSRNVTFTSTTSGVIGGLIGGNYAAVSNAWSTGTVSGSNLVGGLIGTVHGAITNSWSSANVTGTFIVGGLGGDNGGAGPITDSYATGNVTSTANNSAGGILGSSVSGTLTRVYASGTITSTTAGGLIGNANNSAVVIVDGLWDTESTGTSVAVATGTASGTFDTTGGCFGATSCTGGGTVDLTQLATYTGVGWSSTAGVTGSINGTSVAGTTSPNYTWFLFPGETRPVLLSELYPTTSTVRTIRNSHQLQLAASTRGHNYTLGNDIDLASGMTNTSSIWGTNSGTSTGSGFLPIGDNTLNYTGTFNGGSFDVTNIYIDRTTTDYTGLFGRTSAAATIQNIGVTGTIAGQTYVGGIAGYNAGTISNTHANVNITLNPGFQRVGGITGENASGATITNSYTEGSITGTNPAGGFSRIGGIAGSHSGTMTNVFSDMAITTTNTANASNLGGIVGEALAGLSNFYFTGSVTVNGPASDVGGLIGILNGAITAEDFYNIGSFTVTGAGDYVGGLIGVMRSNAIAQNGFQAGYVSTPGGSKTVGLSCCGTNALNNVFYDTLTTGGGTTTIIADFGGNALTATGDSRTNLMAQATYPQGVGQWDFTTTWGIVEGRSYPYLRSFYSSAPRIIAGFVNGGSANVQVDLVSNGNATPVATNNTANAGYFYFQLGTNALSGTTNVAANDYLLLYTNDGGTTLANHVTVAPSFNGSLSGSSNIVLTPNTLTIGGDGIATLSHANMSTALGSYGTSDPNDIIFSIDGSNNLTVESGSNYTSYSNVTYQPEGNITLSGGGDISFFSSVQLNNDIAISSDIISISGNITGSTSTRNLTLTNTDVSGFGITGTITTNIGNLVKNGTGTLALSGNNTYTGTTTINAGTLTVSNANALGGTASGTIIASGATLDISSAAIGAEAITLQGGTIASQGTASLAGNVNMTADSFINTGFGSTLTLNGIISGSQAVSFNGFGTIEYGGANTYTGDTNINFSLLRILANDRIPDASDLVFANLGLAGLDLNDFSDTVGSISGGGATAGNIDLGSGTLTITQGSTGTYSAIISGTGNIVKAGASTLTLDGVNTYSGTTTLNAGTLSIAADSGLGADPGTPTAGHLTFNGGTLQTTATMTLDSDRGIALTGNGTIDVSTGTLTYGGIVAGAGNLTKSNTGTLTLSGVNTYTGNTTINGGTLSVAAESGLGAVPGVATPSNLVINGGTLEFTSAFNLDTNRGVYIGASGATFDASNNNINGIVDGPGTITAVAGFFRLINTANTYTGGTVINGANFAFAADGSLGAVPGTVDADNVIVNSGDFAAFAPLTTDANRGILLNAASVNFSGQMTINGPISGIGRINRHSTGSLNLTNASNSFSGGLYSSFGSIIAASDSALGAVPGTPDADYIELANNGEIQFSNSFTVNSNRGITMTSAGRIDTSANDITYGGIITGSGNISVEGSGTLTLSGTNTNTGGLTISAGTVSVSADSNLGTDPGTPTASSITLNGGTLLASAGFTLDSDRGITLGASNGTIEVSAGTLTYDGIMDGAGNVTKSGTGTLALTGANTYTGSTTISGGTLSIDADASLGADPGTPTAGHLTFNGGTLQTTATMTLDSDRGIALTGNGTLDVSTGTLTYGGIVAGAGNLTKSNTGTLTLNGVNTYTGSTSIDAGTLSIAADSGLGADPGTPTAGHLTFNGGSLQTIATMTLDSDRGIALTGTGTLDVNTGTLTYGGIIAGTSNLTKAGTGQLTLSGSNTYTGDTNITGGTFNITNANALGSGTNTVSLNGNTLRTENAFTLGSDISINVGTSGTINISNTDVTIAGNINGTSFNKSGGGTLRLSGNNTFGDLTINSFSANTRLSNAEALGTGTTTVNNESSLTLDFTGTLNDTGQINIIGDGAGGSPTGALLFTANATLNNPISLGSNAHIGASSGITGTLAGVVSGSNALTKVGSGTAILTGTNTYSGATTISAGTISISADSGLGADPGTPTAGHLTFNGGTLQTTATMTLDSDRGIALTGNGTLDVSTGTLTYGGIIAGAGNLTKSNTGTLTLNGVNTYTGSTSIDAGTLSIAADSGLGADPGTPTAGHLTFNGGTLQTTATMTLDSDRGIALTGNGTFDVSTGTLTYGGIVAGAGNLTKSNTGTLTLSGVNTYTGNTTINGGTLSVAAESGLGAVPGAATPSNLVINGGTLEFTSAFNLDTNRGVYIGASGATFDASNNNINGIVDGPGTITAVAGFFRLINTANTYTGGTVINGANFAFAADGSLGAVPGTVDANNVIVNSGDFAAFAPLTTDANRGILLNAASVNFSGQMTINGPISGIGRINRHSTGSLNLTNASNSFSGGLYSSFGSIIAASDSALGAVPGTPDADYIELANNGEIQFSNSFTVNSNRGITMTSAGRIDTLANDITYGGIITGSGNISVEGSGTLTLSGTNTNTGGVTVSNGTLTATSAGALGTSGAITIDPGNSQTAILDLTALTSLTNTSAITLESNATSDAAQLNTSNTINLSNAITLTDTSNTISVGANTTTLSGTISGSGGFTKSGSGTLSVTQANSYTGGTTISGGTLTMGDSSALGTGGNVTFNGASTTLGFTANVSLSRPIIFTTAGAIDISGQQVFISGDTSGTGTLTVSNSGPGTGSSELLFFSSGSNTTRAASTIINNGSQVILNSADNLGTTGITVNSGASLRLSNSTNLNIPLTINGTGYAPLGSTGALYVAQTSTSNQVSSLITLGSDATIYVATTGGNPATTMNQIDFNGNNLTINNGTTLNLADQLYGAGNLTKQGSGTLSLQASNLYSGTTSIEAGIVSVEAINAMNAGAVSVTSGATLSLSNTIANALTLRGTGTSGQGALVASGSGTANGNITLASSVSVGIGAPTGGDTLTVGGSISGAEQLVYSGSGTINQNGNISGVTNITVGAGFTQFNVGASSIASSLVQTYSSPIRLTNDLSITANTLTLNAVTTDGTARSLTANSGGGSLTLNGEFGASGAGNSLSALTLTAGSGNLTLGSNNIFSNGNVSLTATAGLVSQTTGSISGGTFTVSAANGISLTNNNSVTSLDATITGTGNLSYTDTGALSLAGISVGTNSATITTSGTLTQTGTIAAGDASFSVGANAITLTNTNAITGTATFNNSGANNVALTNASVNLDIGTSNVGSGTFSVTNTGEMTTSGVITSSGGDITLTTLTSDNSERDLTVGANILSTGGNISLNAANNDTDSATPLIINGDIDTSPGTGGTVITSGGTNITGTITPGGGNITLNGGGLDLTLGTFTVTNDITLTAIRNIILNGDITALNGNIIFDRPVILGANITLTASDTGTQTFTYNSGLSGSNTFNVDATGTGTYQLVVNGTINTSGISFNGGTNASNSSITLASGGSQVYSINAPNAGSISGDNIQGSFTFTNTPNLTGGANGNAFNFIDTGSISGTVDGTTTNVSSTVSFENYSSGIIVAFDSQYAGNITNSSSSSLLVNFDNIDDIVSNLNNIDSSTVKLAPKASTLNITGATSGFIDDPTYVTNFNSYEATAGDSTVNFTTSAVLDPDTGTATVDGSTITFVNFDNYTGNFTTKETVTNVLESAEVEAEAEVKTIESDASESSESIVEDQKTIADKIIDETLVGQGKACATVRNVSGQAAVRGGAGSPAR